MDINNFNPYGLYRNNKKRTRIPRLKSSELDDQTYGFWLPFYDKKGNIDFSARDLENTGISIQRLKDLIQN